MAELEVKLFEYTGLTPWNDASGVPARVVGLSAVASKAWPDLRFPTGIVALPEEDYAVMVADLRGQLYTPHRRALKIIISKERLDPVPTRWQEFWSGIGKLTVTLLAYYGAVQLFNLIAESFR